MPVSATCGDCGKKYVVSSTMAGKRVKCKVCGHVFRVGNVAAKPAAPPKAAPVEPTVIYQHDLGIAGAFAGPPPASLSPPADRLAMIMRLLSWIQLRWWIVLILFFGAVAIGMCAHNWPVGLKYSSLGFPILAGIFLILGMIYLPAAAMFTRGDEKIPWGDVPLVLMQFVLVVFLRLRSMAYKRTVLRLDQYRRLNQQLLILLIEVVCVAGMGSLPWLVKSEAKMLPTLDKTQRAIENFLDDSHKHHHKSDAETP